jgi:hypothetical protein
VKQLCADDSAATSVKVGYRQASYIEKPPSARMRKNAFSAGGGFLRLYAALKRQGRKKGRFEEAPFF